MSPEPLALTSPTIVATAVTAAAFILLVIIQPGLNDDRRTFSGKTYTSIEAMFLFGGIAGITVGVLSRFGVLALDILAGVMGTQMLTTEVFNGVMTAGMLTATAAGFIQWARLRAAFRKDQHALA